MSNKLKKLKKLQNKKTTQREEVKFIYNLPEHKLFQKVKAELLKPIKCSRCGNCCSKYKIQLTIDDIKREPLLMKNSVVATEDINPNEGAIRILNTIGDTCVFYDCKQGCTIYATRPDKCRNFNACLINCQRSKMDGPALDVKNSIKIIDDRVLNAVDLYYQRDKSDLDSLKQIIKQCSQMLFIAWLTMCKNNGQALNHQKPIPDIMIKLLNIDNNIKVVADLDFVKSKIK